MTTDVARIYAPNQYHRDAVMHRSNHDPLWLHNFGQPGYQTAIDYGQHVAREADLNAAYVASGKAAEAAGRYAEASANMRYPRHLQSQANQAAGKTACGQKVTSTTRFAYTPSMTGCPACIALRDKATGAPS